MTSLHLKTLVDFAGWSAALLILSAYALISSGKLQAHAPLYQWMNVAGAIGFIINCAWNGAWPSVALNVVWVGIGVLALLRNRRAAP